MSPPRASRSAPSPPTAQPSKRPEKKRACQCIDLRYHGGMRKSTSRITRLPPEMREEINRKMDQGWAYRLIRKWLFEQVAECDVPALELVKGDSYSLAWLRA